MVEVVEQSRVPRPADAVWAALADFGAISRWAPNVDHSCLTTDETAGVDTVRRVQVGNQALLERVVEWEPNHRLAYELVGLPPVVRTATNTWELVTADGGTTVTLTSRVDAGPRPPQRLAARVIARVLRRASRQMLAGLSRHVEERTG